MLGGVEGGVCLAMCRFVVGTERRFSIQKAVSLFEHHLKIDPLSLFESEGAKQSLVPAEHSLTNTRQV